MTNKQNEILKSFKLRETLNPQVWDNPSDINNAKLKKNIRENLLLIAEQFIEFVKVDVFVNDIILTGSLSNYNWSNFSDFDLHVIVDMSQYDENEVELYKELFDLKKVIFNMKHDIKILNYDVELYIQDEEEPHESTGVYSILFDEWITKPEKSNKKIDLNLVKQKASKFETQINDLIESIDEYDLEDAKRLIKKMKEKLKNFRKSGLDKGGELSYENLAFKYLRRSGIIDRLFELENEYMDKELSIQK